MWNDKICDICYEADNLNVKAASFCDDCVQFMCNKCYKIHERLNATRGHNVKTGTAMPRSQADKPPKFSLCDEHPKHLKNQFCSVHKQLVCSLCSPLYHKNCSTGSVEDACKSISSSETNDLYDTINDIKRDIESSLSAVDSNIDNLNKQKRSMLKQIQELYDKMISKAKKWFDDAQSEIDTHYQSQLLTLKQNQTRINNSVLRIESSLRQIDILRSKPIDAKLFLRIQDILSDMKQYQDDFKAPICNVHLSFVPSKHMQDFISSSYTMGSVKVDESKREITIPEILFPVSSTKQAHAGLVNKVVAAASKRKSARQRQSVALTRLKGREQSRTGPANKVVAAAGKRESARQSVALTRLKGQEQSRAGPANKVVAAAGKRESARQSVALTRLKGREQTRAGPANKVVAAAGKRESARQSVALTQLKGRKLRSHNVKLSDDRNDCCIRGMAITNDGRRLLVDRCNSKVKLFSRDMKLLSSLSLSDPPRDIAVLSDQEAVVTTANKSLVILDISGSYMSINTTTALSYDVRSISKYGEKLAVTSDIPMPASVKLIDKTGRVYWSVSSDGQGQSLFSDPMFDSLFSIPMFVTSDIERNTVTVTDFGNFTLTLLNGDTGDIIKRRDVDDKGPYGVTTGPSGNIYVCYYDTREVAELTGDLSEERILLSQQDGLGVGPYAITYDKISGQLITSYYWFGCNSNNVDIWELS